MNTLTLETYDASEELILDKVPGLLDAIFDLMDKLNPAVAQVLHCVVLCGVVLVFFVFCLLSLLLLRWVGNWWVEL